MKLVSPLAAALSSALLLSIVTGCGGSSPSAPPTTPSKDEARAETPAERCLAIAGAPRERKPDEPAKITAKHILVKYAGAKRAPETVTRTRDEACLRALEAREKLQEGVSFAEIVSAYSEEPGAATREGSLGSIQRPDVVPAFADAAFELGRGDVSHVVETDYGFHIIMRTE